MAPLSVGLVGYGFSGSTFHAPVLSAVDTLSLAAVVTSQGDKVTADWPGTRVYDDIQTLLADSTIDLVVITSPNTLHYTHARAALEAGKHVVVEKPFTITSREADELIELAERQGLVLSVYHNRRWDNDFLTIRKIITSDLLGRVHDYEAHFDRYRLEVRDRWRERDLPGSGNLYDLGSHLIDQALVLFGSPQTVFADLRKQRPGAHSVDSFYLLLGYEQCRVVLCGGMLIRAPGPRFQLHGDQGSFVKYGIDPQEEALRQGGRPGEPGWGMDGPETYGILTTEVAGLSMETRIPTEIGNYQSYYRGISEAICHGRPSPVKASEARDTIRVLELAEESQRRGQRTDW